jgi:haloalkane dehalogenase
MSTINALDSTMYYEESGAGVPVVFLHGNPASSYLWRKVTPQLADRARALAPDLIGMGASGRPEIAYDFSDHARYLEAWFDALELREVVLVGHDWGGALALDWASRHPGRVRAVALLETFLRPLTSADLSEPARERFEAFRRPGVGEKLVLEQNVFLETAFTGGVLNPLSEEEVAPYKAPYPTPESRRPMLAWPRMLPVDGDPADVVARIEHYDAWLAESPSIPKLLLTFDSSPTLLVTPEITAWAREHIVGLEVQHLGAAGHHAPEDRPVEIGRAIADWLDKHALSV